MKVTSLIPVIELSCTEKDNLKDAYWTLIRISEEIYTAEEKLEDDNRVNSCLIKTNRLIEDKYSQVNIEEIVNAISTLFKMFC